MSTRWYPLYQKGGPQLRVFLPNFWLKLVRPTTEQPPNVVQFACSMEMTRHDIKSYLEKIYDIKPVDIRTRVVLGKTKRDPYKGYVTKGDDTKLAYITLHKDFKFTFPDLYPEKEKDEKSDEAMEQAKEGYQSFLDKNKQRPNMPGWFTI